MVRPRLKIADPGDVYLPNGGGNGDGYEPPPYYPEPPPDYPTEEEPTDPVPGTTPEPPPEEKTIGTGLLLIKLTTFIENLLIRIGV
ncbi:hypothetical protein LCGC14_3164030 [marine sediment metagenome]|uniref:Uncharacterized protein n=1 Tax=marine sediment metagenome TaxID=412755 RepID=A0A0F8VPR0_9ZZZZ